MIIGKDTTWNHNRKLRTILSIRYKRSRRFSDLWNLEKIWPLSGLREVKNPEYS